MLEEEPLLKLAAKIPTVHSRFIVEIETALQQFEKPDHDES
jgi:hypothetical protein